MSCVVLAWMVSLGAMLAYETVLALSARGIEPSLVVPIAGACPRTYVPTGRVRSREEVVDIVEGSALVPADGRGSAAFERFVVDAFAADLALADGYDGRGCAPIHTPVLALAGNTDPVVPPPVLEQWWEIAHGGFRLQVVDGDHFVHQTGAQQVVHAVTGAVR